MIAASAVLVVAALVLLIVGVFQDGLELVFGSIAASIIAAISLFLGVLKDRRAPVTAPGYPVEGAPVGGATAVVPSDEGEEAAPLLSPLDEEMARTEQAPTLSGIRGETSVEAAPPLILPDDDELEMPPAPAPAAPRRAAAKKPARRKPAAKKATAKKPAAKKPAAKKPAAKKPAAKKPAAKKAAAKRPAAKKAAAKKSTTRRPSAR